MHKLVRSAEPTILNNLRRRKPPQQWHDIGAEHKEIIWQHLIAMQGYFCAYCERKLPDHARHIEHFRQRKHYAEGLFEWSNLFGSCNTEDSCGKYKDQTAGEYDWRDLLKPDQDDPDEFLQFFADGTIRARDDLDSEQKRRAVETLRVFNLDAERGPLRRMRKDAISGWLQNLEELKQMADDDKTVVALIEADIEEELGRLMLEIESQPFATAIRHSLQWASAGSEK